MKVFVVLSCIALAVARPEAGYSYNQPGAASSSFGGSGSFSNGGGSSFSNGGSFGGSSFSSGGSSFSGSSALSSGSSLSSGFGAGQSFSAGPSFGDASSHSSGASLSAAPAFSAGAPSFSAPSFSAPSFSAPGPAFQSAAQPQQALIQKHIYVHVAPPQEEDIAQPHFAPAQPQKHYKIIFIKAPSAPAVNLQQLIPPQHEEKTLVYVLSKKQESVAELAQHIQPAPVVPTKPEVYFIKYKTQKEQSAGPISAGPISAGPISAGPISSGLESAPISSGSISSGFDSIAVNAPTTFQSGSAEASLPISAGASAPHAPAPVYGPAH